MLDFFISSLLNFQNKKSWNNKILFVNLTKFCLWLFKSTIQVYLQIEVWWLWDHDWGHITQKAQHWYWGHQEALKKELKGLYNHFHVKDDVVTAKLCILVDGPLMHFREYNFISLIVFSKHPLHSESFKMLRFSKH